MPRVLHVSAATARRFMVRALLLDQPAASIGAALAHHGFVQIDPINVCGRMHDLILRNRVQNYREGDLMRHVHGEEDAPCPRISAWRSSTTSPPPATSWCSNPLPGRTCSPPCAPAPASVARGAAG